MLKCTDSPGTMQQQRDQGEGLEDQGDQDGEMVEPAFQNRRDSRQEFERHDRAYGRFVLRGVADMTIEDRAYLRSGNNDLIQQAVTQAGMSEASFLEAIFEGDSTTAAAPTAKPIKPARVAADSTVPCGIFIRDSYLPFPRTAVMPLLVILIS